MSLVFQGCKKIIGLDPVTEIDDAAIRSDDAAAVAATLGLYERPMTVASFRNGNATRCFGLYSDEIALVKNNAFDQPFALNQLQANNLTIMQFWNSAYYEINFANRMLENLSGPNKLTRQTITQLKGEVLFIRAMTFFDLVNLFGPVPLVLSADPNLSVGLGRAPETQVYERIISDLKEAQSLLPVEYPKKYDPPANRVRANKGAATALLAKAYLFTRNYAGAIEECNKLEAMGLYQLEKDLDNVFLATSKETIFAFLPVNGKYNTIEGKLFLSNTMPPPYVISGNLYNSFENGDRRLEKWVKLINNGQYKVPAKYKVHESEQVTEYNVMIRMAEIYLIRAEAYAAQNRLSEAFADIDKVRERAGLAPLKQSDLSGNNLIATIEAEDLHEFFSEVGHHWFNLRRWKSRDLSTPHLTRADDHLYAVRPGHWAPFKKFCPIPRDEILKSVNLTQNEGY